MMIFLVILLTFLRVSCTLGDEVLCEISIDITDGIRNGTDIIKNDIVFTKDDYFQSGDEIRGCICNIVKCVRRCCLDNETYTSSGNITVCVPTSNNDLEDVLPNFSTFNIIRVPVREICSEGTVNVTLDSKEYDFEVSDTGALEWEGLKFIYSNYCVANVDNHVVAIVCVIEEATVDAILYAIGMIISMPFLFATLLVYALLPDRNLHQKALMFYVLSLLLAYIFLVTIQLSTIQFEETKCQFLGFSAMFCFMVSFFWMNVICLDIWFTFSGSRGLVGSRRDSERRRFLWYCLYALGIPVLHITVVILINAYGDQEADYIPGVGMGMCFVRDGLPSFLYLYLPMGLLITANIVLFACTAFKIRQVKKETSMLKQNDSKRHSYEKDKQKFNLYLKLLLAMGVNWSMEVISFAVIWKMGKNLPHYIWYLTDICNALYGVFIFFIFVFKKKIWKLLQKRYYVFIGKPQLAHSLTTTATTRASNYSSGNSTADTTLTDARSHVGTNGVRSEEIALTRR